MTYGACVNCGAVKTLRQQRSPRCGSCSQGGSGVPQLPSLSIQGLKQMTYAACIDCGKEKTGRQRNPRCLSCAMKGNKANSGKTFSSEHRHAMSLARGGTGIDSLHDRGRWALAVKERDCWRCVCGHQGEAGDHNIDAHHIVPRALTGLGMELSASLSNGITLCRSCHRLVHGVLCPKEPELHSLYESVRQHT